MPKRLTQFDPSTKNFNLVSASSRGIGRYEFFVLLRDKVFVVTVPQDCFKDVLALAHKICFPIHTLWEADPTSRPQFVFTLVDLFLGPHDSIDAVIIDARMTESRKLCEGAMSPHPSIRSRRGIQKLCRQRDGSHAKSGGQDGDPASFCQGGNPQH